LAGGRRLLHPEIRTVVTWNPQLSDVKGQSGTKLLFDSSKMPGEILDALLVDTATAKDAVALRLEGMAMVSR
jgi:NitT/TauT family transport system substrate-binding protein